MREAYAKFIGAGWNSVGAPVEAGGGGAPRIVSAALTELWSAANPAFAMCGGLTQGAVAAISWSGTPEQKSVYLEPMVEGRWTGTMNLTEPQAGTDLAAIRTLARPQDDQTWRVSGQKIYISWGDHDLTENIVHLVLARTPDAPAGVRGLSLFIVPKFLPDADGRPGRANGVTPIALEHKMGIKGSPTCVLQYEDATGFLLGELNQGLPAMFVMMNLSRLGSRHLGPRHRRPRPPGGSALRPRSGPGQGPGRARRHTHRPPPRRSAPVVLVSRHHHRHAWADAANQHLPRPSIRRRRRGLRAHRLPHPRREGLDNRGSHRDHLRRRPGPWRRRPISRTPASPSTTATSASLRSTKAPPRSRPTTSSAARFCEIGPTPPPACST